MTTALWSVFGSFAAIDFVVTVRMLIKLQEFADRIKALEEKVNAIRN